MTTKLRLLLMELLGHTQVRWLIGRQQGQPLRDRSAVGRCCALE